MGFLPINSGSRFYAAINVIYTGGEICTLTGGGRTWTAPNTDGEWTFAVSKAGVYTVKAGEREQELTVTAQGQCFVVNLASAELVIDGEGYAPGMSLSGTGTATVNSEKAIEVKGLGSANAYLYFPEIDVTNYSTMQVRVKGTYYCSYGLGTTSALTYSVKGVQNYVEETLSLDISSITGKYRPAVYVGLHSTDIVTTIYEWWLE